MKIHPGSLGVFSYSYRDNVRSCHDWTRWGVLRFIEAINGSSVEVISGSIQAPCFHIAAEYTEPVLYRVLILQRSILNLFYKNTVFSYCSRAY